jgi:hypothetical protein
MQSPLDIPALRLFAHLFDMNLVEWGLAGPDVRAMLAPVTPTQFEDPTSLPGLSWVTYVSPDLAYPADLAASTHLEGIRRVRTHLGGALMALRTPAEEPELALLRERSPGLFATWCRPPIDAYPLPGGDQLLARDISPGLAACQRDAAHVALEESQRHGVDETELVPATLDAVDRAFAPSAATLPPWLIDSWSALAGEIAVHFGAGRWRRELDPRVPFPNNLLVLLPGHVTFAPHRELLRMLDGSGSAPGQVLRERLALSQARASPA